MAENSWKFGGLEINGEVLGYWNKEVSLAREFRKKYFYDDENDNGRAMDCYKYYLGDQEILNAGLETPIVDNQIAPIVNVFIASIMHTNPDIIVKMRRQSEIPYQQEITKSVYSYFQEELKMAWHNQHATFDAYVTGLGVKTMGYDSEFDDYEVTEKVKNKVKKRKGLGRGKGWKTIEEEVESEITTRKEWITKEFPFLSRHSPLMTIPDPRSKSSLPYDGKWIVLEYEVP